MLPSEKASYPANAEELQIAQTANDMFPGTKIGDACFSRPTQNYRFRGECTEEQAGLNPGHPFLCHGIEEKVAEWFIWMWFHNSQVYIWRDLNAFHRRSQKEKSSPTK